MATARSREQKRSHTQPTSLLLRVTRLPSRLHGERTNMKRVARGKPIVLAA